MGQYLVGRQFPSQGAESADGELAAEDSRRPISPGFVYLNTQRLLGLSMENPTPALDTPLTTREPLGSSVCADFSPCYEARGIWSQPVKDDTHVLA